MSKHIQAIETRWNGWRFRSRLEARWAVYFADLGLEFQYEVISYQMGEVLYLPDFWLPQVGLWAEVKPHEFDAEELTKVDRLVRGTDDGAILLIGPPDFKTYATINKATHCGQSELIWGDVLISNYHNYPRDEHRFYSSTEFAGEGQGPFDIPDDAAGRWARDEIAHAIHCARSARFEHDEQYVEPHKPRSRSA